MVEELKINFYFQESFLMKDEGLSIIYIILQHYHKFQLIFLSKKRFVIIFLVKSDL